MTETLAIEISEFCVTDADANRSVLIRREIRHFDPDGVVPTSVWVLYSADIEGRTDKSNRLASYDDDLLPLAQRHAAEYLSKMREVDAAREEAVRLENEARASFVRPNDMLRRVRHFTAEDAA